MYVLVFLGECRECKQMVKRICHCQLMSVYVQCRWVSFVHRGTGCSSSMGRDEAVQVDKTLSNDVVTGPKGYFQLE